LRHRAHMSNGHADGAVCGNVCHHRHVGFWRSLTTRRYRRECQDYCDVIPCSYYHVIDVSEKRAVSICNVRRFVAHILDLKCRLL